MLAFSYLVSSEIELSYKYGYCFYINLFTSILTFFYSWFLYMDDIINEFRLWKLRNDILQKRRSKIYLPPWWMPLYPYIYIYNPSRHIYPYLKKKTCRNATRFKTDEVHKKRVLKQTLYFLYLVSIFDATLVPVWKHFNKCQFAHVCMFYDWNYYLTWNFLLCFFNLKIVNIRE